MSRWSTRIAAVLGAATTAALVWIAAERSPSTRPEPDEPVEAPPAAPHPGVLWGSCSEVKRAPDTAPTCILLLNPSQSARTLPLWTPSTVSDPKVTLEGRPLDAERASVDDGTSIRVQPPHSGILQLTGVVDGERAELLTLRIEYRPNARIELKAEVDAALGQPELQRALEAKWRRERETTESPLRKLLLTRALQFVVFDQGRWEDSASLATEVARRARAMDRPIDECNAAWSAAFLYANKLGRLDEAVQLLDTLCDHAEAIPGVAMKEGYFRGLLQIHAGDIAAARHTVERGLDIARRLRVTRWERLAIDPLLAALSSQGRFRWARSLLDRSRELARSTKALSSVEACESRMAEHELRGELTVREAQMLGVVPSAAREHFDRAAAVVTELTCPSHDAIRNALARVHTMRARLAFETGSSDEATELLDAIPPEDHAPLSRLHARLLRVELALLRDQLDVARTQLDELDADATSYADRPAERWRHRWLEARLHQARGLPDRAIESLVRAQRDLDDAALATGVSVEADRALAMHRQSGQLLVRLLLEQDLVEPALCAARIARVRGLVGPTAATLEEDPAPPDRFSMYAWYDPADIPVDERLAVENALDELMTAADSTSRVRCEDLPRPAPGEVSVLPFDDGERWVAFAWDGAGRIVAEPLAPGPLPTDPIALGDRLLSPLDALLADARRLRAVVPAALADVAISRLQWRGAPVGDAMTVAHAVDLPLARRSGPEPSTAALVFSDPRKQLHDDHELLRDRFQTWSSRLDAHGLRVTASRPPGSPPITVRSVLDDTARTRLALLYGFGGTHWSRYQLGTSSDPDGVTFDLGATGLLRADILLQRGRVPRHVILAHCDSATVDPHGVSGATGLAQSYVQAGSEWAVGTADTIGPDTMLMVVDALLDAYPRGSTIDDIASVLRRVETKLIDEGSPDADTLRLWIP